jgi:hypothetical protein
MRVSPCARAADRLLRRNRGALGGCEGRVFTDTAAYAVVDPPAPRPAADDGKSRLRGPNIYEVYFADWPRHEFTDASVGRAYRSPSRMARV